MSQSIVSRNIGLKDQQVLVFLFSAKVATSKQINEEVYRYRAIRSTNKRLKMLEDFGLVQGIYHKNVHPVKIYSLTSKGFRTYVSDGTETRKQFKSHSIVHDLKLNDIRARLIRDKVVTSYLYENDLASWSCYGPGSEFYPYQRSNCDAVVDLMLSQGMARFSIEFEASYKHSGRYEQLIAQYYANKGLPYVIYIGATDRLLSDLKAIDRSKFSQKKPKLFFANVRDVVEGEKIEIVNREGKKILLYPRESHKIDGPIMV